jgi:hypothetical protein
MSETSERTGGCACDAVRIKARGEPLRVGLCHCMDCRKAHASAFMGFAVFNRSTVELSGETKRWFSKPWYERHFCPQCGSRVAGIDTNSDEIELPIGVFDEVGAFTPQYENWVIRREPWLRRLDVPQNDGDRQFP